MIIRNEIESNKLGDKGAKAFGLALKLNKTLQKLYLSFDYKI